MAGVSNLICRGLLSHFKQAGEHLTPLTPSVPVSLQNADQVISSFSWEVCRHTGPLWIRLDTPASQSMQQTCCSEKDPQFFTEIKDLYHKHGDIQDAKGPNNLS